MNVIRPITGAALIGSLAATLLIAQANPARRYPVLDVEDASPLTRSCPAIS